MTGSETAERPHGGDSAAEVRLRREETARLGSEIYERDIRPLVERDHQGQVVAIDVDSGSYALGEDAIVASDGLRGRRPDARVWLMRVGHRALYHFGGRVTIEVSDFGGDPDAHFLADELELHPERLAHQLDVWASPEIVEACS